VELDDTAFRALADGTGPEAIGSGDGCRSARSKYSSAMSEAKSVTKVDRAGAAAAIDSPYGTDSESESPTVEGDEADPQSPSPLRTHGEGLSGQRRLVLPVGHEGHHGSDSSTSRSYDGEAGEHHKPLPSVSYHGELDGNEEGACSVGRRQRPSSDSQQRGVTASTKRLTFGTNTAAQVRSAGWARPGAVAVAIKSLLKGSMLQTSFQTAYMHQSSTTTAAATVENGQGADWAEEESFVDHLQHKTLASLAWFFRPKAHMVALSVVAVFTFHMYTHGSLAVAFKRSLNSKFLGSMRLSKSVPTRLLSVNERSL
jgi:hypothetical protein